MMAGPPSKSSTPTVMAIRRLFHQLDGWIVQRLWSHRHKRWPNAGCTQLPERNLTGEYGLVRLTSLVPEPSMRHLCESGLRENRTGRLSGGRRPDLRGASSDPTLRMPGNAGGGKEPWFESDAERGEGMTTGESLPGSAKVLKHQTVLHAKATNIQCVRACFPERQLVRFAKQLTTFSSDTFIRGNVSDYAACRHAQYPRRRCDAAGADSPLRHRPRSAAHDRAILARARLIDFL